MKKQNGITIVAFVTIIVIALILAGISIVLLRMSKGDNLVSNEETVGVNSDVKQNEEINEIAVPGIVVNEDMKYKDDNNDIAVIPQGFKLSEKKDEQLIDNGLVVIGPDNSEFVWVPVDKQTLCVDGINGKEIAKQTNVKDSNGRTNYEGILYEFSETTSTILVTDNKEPEILTTDENSNNTIDFTKESIQEEYNEIIESIQKNGGFYVGRYESGILNLNSIGSIQGILPMNAAKNSCNTWYGLYKKQKDYSNTLEGTNIKSTMITGSHYDAILNWALQGDDKEKVTAKTNGNHIGTLVSTGNEKYLEDKINNIYDLEGNLSECTSEANSTSNRVSRGGDYKSVASPSERTKISPNSTNIYDGSRLLIYL